MMNYFSTFKEPCSKMRGTSDYFSKDVSVVDPLTFERLLGKVSGSIWVWLPLTLRLSYELELLCCGFRWIAGLRPEITCCRPGLVQGSNSGFTDPRLLSLVQGLAF